jgi:hypothetical protein
MRSTIPAERFAAALLIPAVLAERLRELSDFNLGQLLDREVCSNLSLFAPELLSAWRLRIGFADQAEQAGSTAAGARGQRCTTKVSIFFMLSRRCTTHMEVME